MNRRTILAAAVLTLGLLLIPVRTYRSFTPEPPSETLRCVVPKAHALFHKTIIQRYAESQNLQMDFHADNGEWLDSLRSGAIDLLVFIPLNDSIPEGIACSRAFADGSVWAVRADETEGLRRINRWMTELLASEAFGRMQKQYFAGKPVNLQSISQYDRLLKASADSIGWDWRLLAAVVYHESRFHNEATSAKGATGLMQVRSDRYSTETLLDPARNLSVGSRYLYKLEAMFSNTAATPMEAVQFALAAFNLGEGRVQKLIGKAAAAGADTTRWESVATMLPARHRTITYVDEVLDTYAYYSQVYPE